MRSKGCPRKHRVDKVRRAVAKHDLYSLANRVAAGAPEQAMAVAKQYSKDKPIKKSRAWTRYPKKLARWTKQPNWNLPPSKKRKPNKSVDWNTQ